MAFVEQYGCALPDSAPSTGFEHNEEFVEESQSPTSRQAWAQMINRHIGASVFDVNPAVDFPIQFSTTGLVRGRLRSGRFGALRYCRLWSSAGRALQRSPAQMPMRCSAAMVMVFSGTVHYETGGRSIQVRAGEFAFVNELRHELVVENDDDMELVILFDPLDQEQRCSWRDQTLVHRRDRTDAAAMLSRWLQDACADRGFRSGQAADSMALVVRALAWEVMHERPVSQRPRLNRRSIESEVGRRLDDPTLSLQDLADRFHCSVRTLHRVFRRDGEESLERYIRHKRVEACAQRLLGSEGQSHLSLTELALQFGFSSSSHFSNAFRARFGVSPSSYRQADIPT